MLGVAVSLGVPLMASRRPFRLIRERSLFFVTCATLGYLLPLFLQLLSAARRPTGTPVLIFSMPPIVAVTVALVMGSDRIPLRGLCSIALGTLAVLVVLLPEIRASNIGTVTGMLIVGYRLSLAPVDQVGAGDQGRFCCPLHREPPLGGNSGCKAGLLSGPWPAPHGESRSPWPFG